MILIKSIQKQFCDFIPYVKTFKRYQKFLEKQNSRRIFLQQDLQRINLSYNSVLNTGFDCKQIQYFGYPYRDYNDETFNTTNNSYLRVVLPFKNDKNLANLFVRFNNNQIRIGKMLELMDTMAGHVCYQHLRALKEHHFVCVTASVDDFEIFNENYTIDQTCVLDAYLTYVGNRTMEIRVDLSDENNELQLTVKFLFVAKYNPNVLISYEGSCINYKLLGDKDKHNLNLKPIPKINFDLEDNKNKSEFLSFLGRVKQQERIKNLQQSTLKQPPSIEETQKIHQLLMNPNDQPRDKHIQISQTRRTKYLLSHVADKNLQNTTFGGLMMREQFELGFITAYLFSNGDYPHVVHINDTQFYAPVPYGSMIKFESHVTYLYQNYIHVSVVAETIQREKSVWNKKEKSNEFNVTFQILSKPEPLLPNTYREAMMYIEGERKVKNLLNQKQSIIYASFF